MLYNYMEAFEGKLEEYGQQQFSQFGEDVALWAWVETLKLLDSNGFYLDIGAHHPVRGSNTYLLRKLLGWTGINVEPDPVLFEAFTVQFPECINLQVAVGSEAGSAELSIFNHPGVNTISEVQRDKQELSPAFHVVGKVTVEVRTINDILETSDMGEREFRLLTIDAEGLDLDIIKTLDLQKYRPNLIMIEDFEMNLGDPNTSQIYAHLHPEGYRLVSHCMVTSIYRRMR